MACHLVLARRATASHLVLGRLATASHLEAHRSIRLAPSEGSRGIRLALVGSRPQGHRGSLLALVESTRGLPVARHWSSHKAVAWVAQWQATLKGFRHCLHCQMRHQRAWTI